VPRVRVVHWKDAEAEPLLAACRACGFEIEYDPKDPVYVVRAIRTSLPDAVVIDLTCRPSHGRELALAIRSRKYSRGIPIVFVDGDPEKVALIRTLLPDATYTTRRQLCTKVRAAMKNKVASPVAPPTVMERYGSRTKAQKLGIAAGTSVALYDPPRNYLSVLGEMPERVEFREDPEYSEAVCPVTLWFVHDPRDYRERLRTMRGLAGKTKLWVVWPKGATNGLNGNIVREYANDVGLVDYKICAVGEKWSGMIFAPRKR
jgi:hypothetical protein